MRKLIFMSALAVLVTGCCFSQLPTQYAYADENCVAVLEDYRDIVIVSDNCNLVEISQSPLPGDPIGGTTIVEIRAKDEMGNERVMTFDVVIMDTIAPTMELNPDWQGYTDKEVGTMYRAYYGWVQEKGDEYNEKVAGKMDTIVFQDTTYYHTYDTMRYFFGTIPIFEYRIDEGYWANEVPDLTAWFK